MLDWHELKLKIEKSHSDKKSFWHFPQDIIENMEVLMIQELNHAESEINKNFCIMYLDYKAELPLGSWSIDFINAIYYANNTFELPKYFKPTHLILRALCEEYIAELQTNNNKNVSLILVKIQNFLEEVKKSSHSKKGTKLPYEDLQSTPLLKFVYQSSYLDLVRLFEKHTPMPSISYFGDVLPEMVLRKEQNATNAVKKMFKHSKMTFPTFEKYIINLQRKYRANKRQKEETLRITKRYTAVVNSNDSLNPQQDLYIPQKCSNDLASRIVNIAKKVKFIKNIRHETKLSAIKSIFNEGLYGRRTLLNFFMPFAPAALEQIDVDNGDGNAICFGTQFIDNQTNSELELCFDFDKINFKPFHCAFFKQFDFGIDPGVDSVKEIKLGEECKIMFYPDTQYRPLEFKGTATGISLRNIHDPCRDLNNFVFNKISAIPNYQLISYDIANINAVLTLNFFRLLDNLKCKYFKNYANDIVAIYREIEKLNDQELFDFLKDVGEKTSCWMEFNFYGAHLINFDALLCVRNKISNESLKISPLIAELNASANTFSSIVEKFPDIFSSYRFLDYLVGKIDNPEVINKIYDLYSKCKAPAWFPLHDKFQFIMKEADPNVSSNSTFISNGAKLKKRKREIIDKDEKGSAMKKVNTASNDVHSKNDMNTDEETDAHDEGWKVEWKKNCSIS